MPTFDGESMVCPYSSESVAEASFFLGVRERIVERDISKFLSKGHVKPEPVSTGVSVLRNAKNLMFLHTKRGNQFLSAVQFPFDNCHSLFSPTTFFEIGVC